MPCQTPVRWWFLIRFLNNQILWILPALLLISCVENTSDNQKTRLGIKAQINPSEQVARVPVYRANGSVSVEDFKRMLTELRDMSSSELLSLSDTEILELAEPITALAEASVVIPERNLNQASEHLLYLYEFANTISRRNYLIVSKTITDIINPNQLHTEQTREFSLAELRDLMEAFRTAGSDEGAGCSELFNTMDDMVVLSGGDHFSIASYLCAPGTQFFILPGIYRGFLIQEPKEGNTWLGIGHVMLDGENTLKIAISGTFVNNYIGYIGVERFTEYGLADSLGGSDNVTLANMTFKNIGADKNGQGFGAIKFSRSKNVEIKNNYYENVTSAIRFINSEGPLRIYSNRALNPGRNFFQCNKCNGPDIEISHNTMEYVAPFGTDLLEDFINIFESNGTEESPIRVHNNRARSNGEGLSVSGSFIILGDFGGSYQEATYNLGINPGQVGIGAASGDHIKVKNNLMYSGLIEGISNTAYYSWKTPDHAPDCSNHTFADNRANWTCGRRGVCRYGQLNRAWSAGNCGTSNSEILENTFDDPDVTPALWNTGFRSQHIGY